MRRLFLALALGCIALAGCSSCTREISVRDVSRDETLILQKRTSQEYIHGISIVADGAVHGDGEVLLIMNGEIYKREPAHGPVRFEWRGDWYSDQAEIRYVAGTVSSGTLSFRYDFKD